MCSTRVQVILIPIKCSACARLVHMLTKRVRAITLAHTSNATDNYSPLTTANKIAHIFLLVNKIQIKFVCVRAATGAHVQRGMIFDAVSCVFCVASNRPMLLRVDNLSISFCFYVAAG